MVFLPNDDDAETAARAITEEALTAEGLAVLGWRDVPVDKAVVGRFAAATEPRIAQVVVRDGEAGRSAVERERALFLARKAMERRRGELGDLGPEFYVCSLSSQVRRPGSSGFVGSSDGPGLCQVWR